ncbi:MAG: EcsC family protein [Nevskiaceae bacterium]|nr:MAG: EcsC family protein [Nevskiaceae bacterium]
MPTATYSTYEKHALKEIHAWKNPQIGWFGQAMKVINQPIDAVGDFVFDSSVGEVLKKVVQGLTGVCHDAAQWSVRPEAIFDEFRRAGHPEVRTHDDIETLDLSDVDKVVGWLGSKYKGIALVEGAGAGVAGAPGLVIDIPALVALNLRAIGEYAAYYGFDTSNQQERLFAFNVLAWASSPTDASKTLAMAQLVRIATDVAKKKSWKELEKHVLVQVVKQIAKALGVNLTKGKLAQTVPVMGAMIGGGFNAYFTMKVCDAAFYLYRERFLAKKYGADVIDVTAAPATDKDPHHPDDEEPLAA